jgi:shikimate dehydrogenase
VVVVNRTPERAETAAALAGAVGRPGSPDEAREMDLVVNATSAGMADSASATDLPPADPATLHHGQVVCDLIYHPLETRWLAAARANGATTLGGLGMLVHQAAIAISSWTGRTAPLEAMWRAARGALD